MTLDERISLYKKNVSEIKRNEYVLNVLGFDVITDCPKDGKKYSYEVQEFYQKEIVKIRSSEEYSLNVSELYHNKEKLESPLKEDIEKEYKRIEKLKRIPKEELYEHFKNLSTSEMAWENARDSLDYSSFEKELIKIVDFNKKYIKWEETNDIKGFDVLLDDMEDGSNIKMYDRFFDEIEKELVPFVKKIIAMPKKYNQKILEMNFDVDSQKKLTSLITNKMGYTTNKGCIRETLHPFTTSFSCNDVRIATRYEEKMLLSNLYSIMHETGHALYELSNSSNLEDTLNLFGGATCALHESQSRFYENYLGRSRGFIEFLYPLLVDIFPTQFKNFTVDDLYYYANDVTAQFYRTEADELTYPIHVLIRYKIEKKLFNNEINVRDIPVVFNRLMKEYLGITPLNNREGCYQDIHWASGFGYFPTYALGSAYGAQFYYAMRKEIDVNNLMIEGSFGPINDWLKEKIQKYGASKSTEFLIKNATGEDFNPNYYIAYLKHKFGDIYNV